MNRKTATRAPLTAAPKRAALYLRFSTGEQGQNAYTTIDAQRIFLTGWAAKNDYQIVGEFADEGKTGTSLKRKGYRDLLAGAKAKQFDAVLVTFMDRLGRGKSYTIAEFQLGEAGVPVVTALQSFAEDTGGYISQSARQMVDGIYPKLVKEWTETKLVSMLAQGYHVSGQPPFGYVAVPVEMAVEDGKHPPKRLVPHEANAEVYREAMRRAADGDTRADVRRYLMSVTEQDWSFDRVNRLLTSRKYRGVATWGNHINEAAHMPLIDEGLWQSVQDALEEAKSGTSRLPQHSGDNRYYLSRRIRCGCGGRMTPYWAKGRAGTIYTYYQCMKKRDLTCSGPGQVSANKVHQAVFVEAAVLAKSTWRLRGVLEQARQMVPDASQVRTEAVRLRREVERLKRERDRFLAAIRVSPASALPVLTQQMGESETELRRVETRLRKAENEVTEAKIPTLDDCQKLLSRMGELWAFATDDERSQLAALLVDEVRVTSKDALEARLVLVGGGLNLWPTRGNVRKYALCKGE